MVAAIRSRSGVCRGQWLARPAVPTGSQGGGGGLLELGIAYLEAGRAIVPTTFASTMFAALLIRNAGTSTQVGKWIPRIARGDIVATVAFGEAEVEREPACLRSSARRVSGGWLLSGTKSFVANAARADLVVVAAKVLDTAGSRMGLFLVTATEGLELQQLATFSDEAQHLVRMNELPVSEAALLGGKGRLSQIEAIYADVCDVVTALQCMEMVGGAERVLEMTSDYVRERHQFGRPIGSFQAVQHHIADMGIAVAGGRLATLKALWLVAEGRPARRSISIAKAWLNRAFVDVTVLAHQLHGGIGYALETDLHLWSQRAKSLEVQGGILTFIFDVSPTRCSNEAVGDVVVDWPEQFVSARRGA